MQKAACMNKNTIFEFHNVSKHFGKKKVFENLNFCLEIDETKTQKKILTSKKSSNIIALLGANGAGKTTFIKMLLGLQTPNTGSISVHGKDPTQADTRAHIGLTPQELDFPIGVKSHEILEFVKSHYKQALKIDDLVKVFDLKDILPLPASKLSGGQKRRLALAMAFIGNPSLVFLDEPTTGLDVIARKAFWEYIQNEQDKTILLTTHDLSEIEKVANRLLFLQNGQIVFDGTVGDFKKTHTLSLKKIKFYSDKTSIEELKCCDCINNILVSDHHYTIDTFDADACIRSLVKNNIEFQNLHIDSPSLEESFFHISQRQT